MQNKPYHELEYSDVSNLLEQSAYHFQLQEERPRPTKIKYSSIYIFGNYIVMYFEKPDEIDELDYPGILNTQNSPNSIWAQLMDQHFLGWEDYPDPWRPTELIASENPF